MIIGREINQSHHPAWANVMVISYQGVFNNLRLILEF